MATEQRDARFEQWVLPHLDAGYNLAMWLARETADADDILQEASLKAYRNLDRFDGREPKAWFLTIVRNEFYTLVRGRSRAAIEELDMAAEVASPDRSPEAAAIAEFDRQQVWDSLGRMAPEFREVIVLRDFEGLSYREIAEMSEIPIGTVMSRLSRARQQLHNDLRATRTKGEAR